MNINFLTLIMEYQDSIGIFSPDGRLYQVEYAQNASNQGSAVCLNIMNNKIYAFYDNKQINNLHKQENKLHKIDDNIFILFSGIRPDSYVIMDEALYMIYAHKLQTTEKIQIKSLASKIATYKQKYTVRENFRPFGLRTVLLGFEENGEPRIYIIEADGNYAEYEKCAVGFKAENLMEDMQKNSHEMCSLQTLFQSVQKDVNNIKGFILQFNKEPFHLEPDFISSELNKS
ncbi:hypothetical protein NUSPORA_00968 [Nucleospora cyclopteri]